jgi:SAM-dependent methyltransferase
MTTATSERQRRYDLAVRLGIRPTLPARLHAVLDAALAEAARHAPGRLVVLDAGCGRKSPLVPFRGRIGRLVGVDMHVPDRPLPYLDDFAAVDVCGDGGAFDEASFDLVLSNFTMEHLADPPTALANMHRWLRPGGVLVVTTVNRRHPFVAAYLGLPDGLRRRVQPLVKASAADAHPLVGRCNDPAAIRAALTTAGFEGIELETLGNLGRAWARRRSSFALGLVGDLLARATPSRRSTILAVARKAVPSDPADS